MNPIVDSRELCDYCRLPIPRSWWSRPESDSSSQDVKKYCCLGCRVAAQVTQLDNETGQSRAILTRLGIAIFLAMNVMVFTMALWSQDVYGFDLGNEATAVLTDLFRYICLLFTIPVLFLLGQPLLVNAVESTRQGRPSTDLLLSVGILAAFGYSVMTVFRGSGHLYFEVVCMVLVLVTLGRWLEATGRQKANAALDALERLVPDTAQKVEDGGLESISRRRVQPGDVLRVFPGERIPIDGQVVAGTAQLDQQVLTGETAAVKVGANDAVYSGSLVLNGPLTIRAMAAPHDDTLARMLEVVRQARLKQGRYARLADRVAAAFLPLVTAIALGTVIWHASRSGLEAGLLNGLAVLLVSCPCALGLATPLAIWNAMNWAARRQVLFRNGDALERLARVRTICFDKTGTLTTGETELDAIIPTSGADSDEILEAARSLAEHSSHPLCRTILAEESDVNSVEACDVTQIPGLGMRGTVKHTGQKLLMGNARWMTRHGIEIPDALQTGIDDRASDGMLVFVAQDDSVLGAMTFREKLRPQVSSIIDELQDHQYQLDVLTGDRNERAKALSLQLGIPVRGQLLPDEKAERIEALKQSSETVLMVGDGINDAPALTVADVGLAMGCGTDLARDSAGICLLGDDLELLPKLLQVSRATMQTVRWNLFWAFGYNTVGIAAAAAGQLNPIVAAILMFGSSLFVITNSLRVTGFEAVEPTVIRQNAADVTAPSESSTDEPITSQPLEAITH
jgi:heavy metal translocating P-type ATPase